MKTVLSALIVTALLSSNVNADQGKGKRGANIEQVITSLQLDAKTSTSLKALFEKHREERKASREKGKKDREQRQASRKQHRQAILDILGYEKMYEFEGMMRQNRGKHGNKKRGS